MILRVHDGYSKCRGPLELFESGKRGCKKGMQGAVDPTKYRWPGQKWCFFHNFNAGGLNMIGDATPEH